MMNNTTIRMTSYVDLDMMIDADYVDCILAEAREYATGFARIPAEDLVVALITAAGPARCRG